MDSETPSTSHVDNQSSFDDIVENTNLNTPECPIKLKSFVGRSFPTLDNAIEFYENYGRRVVFDTRKNGSKKVDDITIWFYMVCNREGEQKFSDQQPKRRRKSKKCGYNAGVAFKFDSDRGYVIQHLNEEHNHPMVEIQHQKFMRFNRKLEHVHQKFISDCVGTNIGPSLTFKLLTELMGGYESVGCTVLDIRNYTRDIRRYAEGYEAQMIIDEMKKKKENCDALTYEYEVDSCSRLMHLFWCDPIAKMNFMQFGDIVSFDTTYSTNRYSMIFAPFTGKDNHGRAVSFGAVCQVHGIAPKLIITDQDLGMKVAVKKFEEKWKTVMKTYELEGVDWFISMFESRRANLVVFLMNFNNAVDAQRNYSANLDYLDYNTTAKMKTEWSLEKHASTIFTNGAFKEIQEQILEAYNHCSLISISNDSSPEVYKDWCHIFLVLKNKKMRLIPENLIGGRWLKSPLLKVVHAIQCQDVATHVYVDEKKKAQAILLGEMLGLYQGVSVDIDQVHELTSIVREARQQIFADGVVTSTAQKKKLMEEFYGAEAPQEVEVQPPEVVSTKGGGSRLPSRVEKALKLKSKPLHQCKKCQEWGHHDSRNCNKFKEKEKMRSRRNSDV
ncbi:protein FAR1-RELATED SEQUENCE 5-like [Salvia splendens]|nr:protein FAR1-RELATED SEQUENCE 5-like [Salvia splendens]